MGVIGGWDGGGHITPSWIMVRGMGRVWGVSEGPVGVAAADAVGSDVEVAVAASPNIPYTTVAERQSVRAHSQHAYMHARARIHRLSKEGSLCNWVYTVLYYKTSIQSETRKSIYSTKHILK